MTVEIIYDAKCKHCKHFSSKINNKRRKQSYCKLLGYWLTLKSKACEKFEL